MDADTLPKPSDRCSTMQLAHRGLTELPKQLSPPNVYDSVLFLNLSENSIQSISKPFFACFPNLSTLDLRSNRLTTLHSDVSLLKNLRVLHLGFNALSSLPFSIGGLRRLEILCAQNNRITSLPSSIGSLAPTLTTLNVSENLIKVVAEEICALRSLVVLNLYHNLFVTIPTSFWKLERLEEFTLEWFAYASPPLPTTLKGPEGTGVLSTLRTVCRELSNSRARELTVMAFLQCFSEEDCSTLVKRRYIIHMAAGGDDLGVLDGVVLYEPGVVNLIDKEGRSALCTALLRGHVEAARILLSHGALVNKGIGNNGSLLHLAVNTLNVELVKIIIAKGAGTNARDAKGNSPLHNLFLSFTAKPHIRETIAKLLLFAGANPNSRNNERWCAVHIAVKQDSSEAIETIVKINKLLGPRRMDAFDLNIPGGEERWTPLHVAAFTGCFDTTRTLLENGADCMARCADGQVPRFYARTHLAVYKLLCRAERRVVRESLEAGENCGAHLGAAKRGLASPIPQKYNPALSLRMNLRYQDLPDSPLLGNVSLSTPRTNATAASSSPLKDRKASCFTLRKPTRLREFEQENPYFARTFTHSELQTLVFSNVKRPYERYFALGLLTASSSRAGKPSRTFEEAIKRFDNMHGIGFKTDLVRAAALFPRVELLRLLMKIYEAKAGEPLALRYEVDSAVQSIVADIASHTKVKL